MALFSFYIFDFCLCPFGRRSVSMQRDGWANKNLLGLEIGTQERAVFHIGQVFKKVNDGVVKTMKIALYVVGLPESCVKCTSLLLEPISESIYKYLIRYILIHAPTQIQFSRLSNIFCWRTLAVQFNDQTIKLLLDLVFGFHTLTRYQKSSLQLPGPPVQPWV